MKVLYKSFFVGISLLIGLLIYPLLTQSAILLDQLHGVEKDSERNIYESETHKNLLPKYLISQSTSVVYPDVTPKDYFFTALQSLVERYNILGGTRGNFNGNAIIDRSEAAGIARAGYERIAEIGNAYCTDQGKRFVLSRETAVDYFLRNIDGNPSMTRGQFVVDLDSSLNRVSENITRMCR
jgi:hypothetical protein